MVLRRCAACGKDKSIYQFGKDAGRKDGIAAKCKVCTRAALNAYRATRPERVRANSRAWAKAHPEQVARAQRNWYEKNRERRLAYDKTYNADPEVRERRNERVRARRRANPEKERERKRLYRERNRERLREKARERYRETHARPIGTLPERLWAKVEKLPGDDCWLWQGARNQSGYGKIQHEKRQFGVHRLVYQWEIGEIPDGYYLGQDCGIRHCVRPDHQRLVDHAEQAAINLAGL